MTTPVLTEKLCPACELVKVAEEFYVKKYTAKDGTKKVTLSPYCKCCTVAYNTMHRAAKKQA